MKQIKYREGVKYQLAEAYTDLLNAHWWPVEDVIAPRITLTTLGRLTIEEGYAWDGPSGPAVDTADFMRASLVHDAFYELIRNGYLPADPWREKADLLMYWTCLRDGMSDVRARYSLEAVRRFGADAASPENIKPVLSAPGLTGGLRTESPAS